MKKYNIYIVFNDLYFFLQLSYVCKILFKQANTEVKKNVYKKIFFQILISKDVFEFFLNVQVLSLGRETLDPYLRVRFFSANFTAKTALYTQMKIVSFQKSQIFSNETSK